MVRKLIGTKYNLMLIFVKVLGLLVSGNVWRCGLYQSHLWSKVCFVWCGSIAQMAEQSLFTEYVGAIIMDKSD